jgi:hypothetical protein
MVVKSSSKNLQIGKRRSQAVKLRSTGATLEMVAAAIAKEFDLPKYGKVQAFRDIDFGLKELNTECRHNAEEYRRQALERLEEMLFRLQPKIKIGETKSIDAAVRIIDRQSKLLGLDAPIQIQVEELVDQELHLLVQGLQNLLPQDTYLQVLGAIEKIGDRAAAAGNN